MIRRAGWFVGATALMLSAGVLTSGAARPATNSSTCADGAQLAAEWGSVEAWRAVAPYPVPREVTPTGTIGVWLERWTMPDGSVELRRVSAGETRVARPGDDCRARVTTLTRRYDSAYLATAFTDRTLGALVASRRTGMVYTWSPGMPLSIAGIATARQAAATLGIAFTAVMADAMPDDSTASRVPAADARPMESVELVYRNATVHYPSVVLYRNGAMLDGVIPGYKSVAAYESLVRARLADAAINRGTAGNAAPLKLWVDHRARVSVLSSVPTPRDLGFFFKPIAGTAGLTYTSNDRAYLFDRSTRVEQRIPGHVDPVPTPDGLFLTRPGLIVYSMDAIRAGESNAIFTDEELPDEYQTASIITKSRSAIRYRVVTGWHDNARFRDYDVTLGTGKSVSRDARFRAVGPAFVPCTGRALSLPISAKSGREFGAFDGVRGTNGILEVTPGGTCVDRLDLGFASGKLALSYDGKALAFSTSRINTDTSGALQKPSETWYQDALYMERANGRIVPLTRNKPLRTLSFPEFMQDGSVMVLDQRAPGQAAGALRTMTVK